MRRISGFSLVEALLALALIGLVAVFTLPALAELGATARTSAAARELALTFQALRWKSVSLNRSHGLYFEERAGDWHWYAVRDGNGNGLRTAEIRRGVDTILSGPHRPAHHDRRVRLGFPPGRPIPRIPPRRGWIVDRDDPVQFGRTDLISFSPLGRASSGTLFVTDGRQELFGVLLFGPTARVRVWRYHPRRGWSL